MPACRSTIVPGYDRTPLFVRRWSPAGEPPPRATVLLAPGYAEHGGRYEALAKVLTGRGLALVAYDHRGFGRSGGNAALARTFDEYVADLHEITQHARSGETASPLFLMGHSMGGAVALLYCLAHGARPDGLVLSSPLVRLPTPPNLQRAALVAGALAPALPTVHLERDAVSRDEAVVAEITADPLCYTGRLKAGTVAQMIRATRRLDALAPQLTLPFLLLHGTADRITDPDGSRTLYARARSADKTLQLLNGFYHETFNDPGGQRVWPRVADWLDQRV